MDVTPSELRSSEIKESWRGYARDDVDDLLERAAATIESLQRQLTDAPSRGSSEPSVTPTARQHEEMLQRTLIMAQKAADEAVNDAQLRARQLLEESEARAQTLVSEAEASARRIAEGERRRLESEIETLAERREVLRKDADALDEYASGYRERLRAAIEADLASLGSSIDPPSERPELSDVEVSIDVTSDEEPAPAASWDHGSSAGSSTWEPAPSTSASASAFAPSERVAPVTTVTASEWPPPAPSTDQPRASVSVDEPWGKVESPAWGEAPSWQQSTGQYEALAADVMAAEMPMEARAVEAEALDDDAFFASLRDAVRDDAALGSRDTERGSFFDGEADEERRKFRRRR